ncbi:hypothetical protein FACS189421_01330 [Bacteroidia bacterium]|nr:hypothetical protein FACS189421_01330 [Bacteroidia bacterium]GHT04584.1 hypothetical protein FACS189423_07490 [Bacteroidia bacterium]GHT46078.1 hypothetical protein FACS189440_03340 [Bacteroidia bacterium]
MNKSILKQAFLLLLSAGIFNSCMTDDTFFSKEKLSPEGMDAQVWYNHQGNKEGIRLISPNGQKHSPLLPDWRMVFSNEDEQYKVTEVNLKPIRKKHPSNEKGDIIESETGFIMMDPECAEKFRETDDKRYMACNIRLIIRTNKETGGKDGFVMIAYPDLPYLEAHLDNPLQHITYLERDKEFSGMVIYHDMDGNWVNACKYIDGKRYNLRIRKIQDEKSETTITR